MKTKKLLVLALAIALIVSSIGFAGAEGNLSAAGEYPIWTWLRARHHHCPD